MIKKHEKFVLKMLEAYHPKCRYLKTVNFISQDEVNATFSVPRDIFYANPDYEIEINRHFNAVEYVICYNQLMYAFLFNYLTSVLPEDKRLTESDYLLIMHDVLITRFDVKFNKKIDTDGFSGKMIIDKFSQNKKGSYLFFDIIFDLENGSQIANTQVVIIMKQRIS